MGREALFDVSNFLMTMSWLRHLTVLFVHYQESIRNVIVQNRVVSESVFSLPIIVAARNSASSVQPTLPSLYTSPSSHEPPFPSSLLYSHRTHHALPITIPSSCAPFLRPAIQPSFGTSRRRPPDRPSTPPSVPLPCLTSQPWYLKITASQSITTLGYTGNFYPYRPEKASRPPAHPRTPTSQLRRGSPSRH